MMQLWTVDPPTKWQAGSVGAAREPIYFSCADCSQKEAKIAGIISTDGTYAGIGLLGKLEGCNLRPAMFCGACFEKRLELIQDLLELAVKYEKALRIIKGLPKTHDGDKGEREQNDMEDAYSNGCDVGTFEGFQIAANIAAAALK